MKKGRKKVKKNVQSGIAHVQSTFNNTVITITDPGGAALCWSTSGAAGFKGFSSVPAGIRTSIRS